MIARKTSWRELIHETALFHYSLGYEKARMLCMAAETVPKGGLIVELGVCHGGAAVLLASIVDKKPGDPLGGEYVGVDDWSLEGSKKEVEDLLRRYKLDHCATLLEGKTQEVPLPNRPIDFLLIDAGHDPENVSRDCERWIPEVISGGLVAFDDCPSAPGLRFSDKVARDADPHWGVRWAADLHTQDWDIVGFWGGLLIRRKP